MEVINGHYEFKLNNLKSENYKTYEIGLKDTLFDQYISAAIFKTYTKDMIFLNWKGGHGFAFAREYLNLDKAQRHGVELYSEQNLFSNKLKLNESFTYTSAKAKYKRGAKEETSPIAFVAKRKFVLGVDYLPIRNLNLFADVKYYSSILNSNYEKMNSKTIVDVSTKYKFTNGLSVTGGIKNLFNKKYYAYYSAKNDIYYPSPERNYYVEFKYSY